MKEFSAISVTVPTNLLKLVEFLKTPDHLSKPPKGTLSALVTMLMVRWVEVELEAEWLSIAATMRDNPDRSYNEIVEFFKAQAETVN